jgi:cytochrome c peroxidase
MKTILISLLTACILFSCKKDETTLKVSYLDLPAEPANYFLGINNNVPELGRVLFYDKQLSVNNSVSCGSCHKQASGFADNVALSRGFDNQLTTRNSMPIQNLGFSNFVVGGIIKGDEFFSSAKLFWDGRETNLGNMVLRPIINHVEMGITDTEALAAKLSKVDYYKPLFKKAFVTDEVTPQKISMAITSFVQSINSTHSKFDKSKNGSGEAQLSALEITGKSLFFKIYNCNTCHQVETPNGYEVFGGGFANIGLDNTYADDGLSKVTGKQTDAGKFKIPSLRNVAFTAPYMHDGRFSTLDEVMEHYSSEIANHPNLDFRLRDANGQADQKNISEFDKKAIIAFLNTLTDTQVIIDPKFASPFKIR